MTKVNSPKPVEMLTRELAPQDATSAAEFAARWWAANLYKPISKRSQTVDVGTLTAPADTWIDRGTITPDQVHQFVREATEAVQAALDSLGEVHVVSAYNGPYLSRTGNDCLGQFAPTPPGVHPYDFPAHTDLRVQANEVAHRCQSDGWTWTTVWARPAST